MTDITAVQDSWPPVGLAHLFNIQYNFCSFLQNINWCSELLVKFLHFSWREVDFPIAKSVLHLAKFHVQSRHILLTEIDIRTVMTWWKIILFVSILGKVGFSNSRTSVLLFSFFSFFSFSEYETFEKHQKFIQYSFSRNNFQPYIHTHWFCYPINHERSFSTVTFSHII